MNVQQGKKQQNSFLLLKRLARRIMDQLGRDHQWMMKEEMTYLAAYDRVKDMDDQTLFRYVDSRYTRNAVDMKHIAGHREMVCETCRCGSKCDVDHSAGISLREIMIHLICEEVCREIRRTHWEYFKAA